ncbi:cell division protein FtsQ/DivIB [Deinococcus ruber]|uniref:cell division protein FtsQ/DivIB n=1 Tax=Deinococcus ruber TaxID=1848197 RepID=UPI00166CBA3E|nr:FtsQ-type POTRA domain-containing protein [Deinococcus ruber]
MTPGSGETPPTRRRRVRPVWWSILSTVLLVGLLAALWFLLPIRSVTVSGNRALSQAQVLSLAGLTPPFYGTRRPGGWLFYGGWRARALRASPWVTSAHIVRTFPDRIDISVTERVPAARWQQPDSQVNTIYDDGSRQVGVQQLRPKTYMPDGTQLEGQQEGGMLYTLLPDGSKVKGELPQGHIVTYLLDGTVKDGIQDGGTVYSVAPNGYKLPGLHTPGRVVTVSWDGSEVAGAHPTAGKVVTIAWDGTILPNARPTGTAPLPLLIGWGPDRLQDARRAALLLASYNVLSVAYAPSGITIQTSAGKVWSGSMDSLLKYSGGVKMFSNQRINIYPWGVSVQQ